MYHYCITKWCRSITDSAKDEYTGALTRMKSKLMELTGQVPTLYDFRLLDDDGVVYAYGKCTTDDGDTVRIPCGYIDLCWWDGEWMQTHYLRTDDSLEEIDVTDRQMRNEYASAAEALHDDVLRTAEENGIDPDDIEWEENPYDEYDEDGEMVQMLDTIAYAAEPLPTEDDED